MTHIDKTQKKHLSFKDIDKLASSMVDTTIKCKCSHSIVMSNADRTICSYCGKWVYRNEKIAFKYKMKEAMIKERK